MIKYPSPHPPQQKESSRKTFIYSQELCQLPHFPDQGQEEVPRLVELVPVSFSGKLSMEAAAGIGKRGGSPGARVRGGGRRCRAKAGISVICNGDLSFDWILQLTAWMALSHVFSLGYKIGKPLYRP